MPRLLACLLMLAAAGATLLSASSVAAQDVKVNIGLGVPPMPPPAVIHHPTHTHHHTGAHAILYAFILRHRTGHRPGSESPGVTCQIGSRCDAPGCR